MNFFSIFNDLNFVVNSKNNPNRRNHNYWIPFILIGVFFSRATGVIRAMSKHLKYYSIIIGCLIIILGVLVLTNQLAYIANFPLLNDLIQLEVESLQYTLTG